MKNECGLVSLAYNRLNFIKILFSFLEAGTLCSQQCLNLIKRIGCNQGFFFILGRSLDLGNLRVDALDFSNLGRRTVNRHLGVGLRVALVNMSRNNNLRLGNRGVLSGSFSGSLLSELSLVEGNHFLQEVSEGGNSDEEQNKASNDAVRASKVPRSMVRPAFFLVLHLASMSHHVLEFKMDRELVEGKKGRENCHNRCFTVDATESLEESLSSERQLVFGDTAADATELEEDGADDDV